MTKNKNSYSTVLVGFVLCSCAGIVPSHPKYRKQETRELTPTAQINTYKAESSKREMDSAIHTEKFLERDEFFLKPMKNKTVNFWTNFYATKNKERLERFAKNGEQYRPIIEKIFAQYGLPKELYYVGIVESGYYNHARSHAGAVGPWQFIKGTARRYGLTVNSKIDERRNIFKSTQAAALYFQDLYNIFGSWELALAAYNAGEYGVIRRIRGANTREYYELSRQKILPKETRHYVPKVLAVKEILENPNRYQLKVERPLLNIYAQTKAIKLKNSISIRNFAKKIGTNTTTLKNLNHDLTGSYIPYIRGGVEVFIPDTNKVSQSDINKMINKRKIAQVSSNSPKKNKVKNSGISEAQIHRVRKNESLYSIAKRYNTNMKTLKRLNHIKGSLITIGQELILPYKSQTHVFTSYKVKKGDHLTRLAKIFNLTPSQIKRMNNLKKSTIWVGQKLRVPKHKVFYYTVSKGDFLGSIAKKMNLNINELINLNNGSTTIYPGQKIIYKLELI